MNRSKLVSVLAAIAFTTFLILSSVLALCAQEKGEGVPKRAVLMKTDLGTVPGHEGVMSTVELAPGVREPKHTHPGEPLGYVREGTISVHVEGKPTATVNAGQAFFVPADTVHLGGE